MMSIYTTFFVLLGFLFACFETESPVAQAGLKVTPSMKMVLNSWSPCFHLPDGGISGTICLAGLYNHLLIQ